MLSLRKAELCTTSLQYSLVPVFLRNCGCKPLDTPGCKNWPEHVKPSISSESKVQAGFREALNTRAEIIYSKWEFSCGSWWHREDGAGRGPQGDWAKHTSTAAAVWREICCVSALVMDVLWEGEEGELCTLHLLVEPNVNTNGRSSAGAAVGGERRGLLRDSLFKFADPWTAWSTRVTLSLQFRNVGNTRWPPFQKESLCCPE